jgi:hypothetical protein
VQERNQVEFADANGNIATDLFAVIGARPSIVPIGRGAQPTGDPAFAKGKRDDHGGVDLDRRARELAAKEGIEYGDAAVKIMKADGLK